MCHVLEKGFELAISGSNNIKTFISVPTSPYAPLLEKYFFAHRNQKILLHIYFSHSLLFSTLLGTWVQKKPWLMYPRLINELTDDIIYMVYHKVENNKKEKGSRTLSLSTQKTFQLQKTPWEQSQHHIELRARKLSWRALFSSLRNWLALQLCCLSSWSGFSCESSSPRNKFSSPFMQNQPR